MPDANTISFLTLHVKISFILRIYRDLSANFVQNCVATIGIFDGVHIAHQQILERINELARQRGKESMLITLWPHPRYVLDGGAENLKLITTLEEKIERLKKSRIDNVLLIPFDKAFASITFDRFVKRVLVNKLNVSYVVIGFNHHFGRDRQGNYKALEKLADKYGFTAEQMPKIELEELSVSSSVIREELLAGNVERAGKLLGYPFSITATVVSGNKLGRKLGFPTANLEIPEIYKIVPGSGVYAIQILIDNKYYEGMMNIGVRPTVDNKGLRVIEANIFEFNEDIYNKKITVYFRKRIRAEKKFQGQDELIRQIALDKTEIEAYLRILPK